jgi:hypothetical protein
MRILRVAGLEGDFAADGGNAEAVAVVGDAADDAIEDAAVGGGFRFGGVFAGDDFAEAEGIEDRDGARAHGEDVAEDAANAGGGSLEGFDVAGMIVGFDFERGDEAIADVDDAGIFAGALDD